MISEKVLVSPFCRSLERFSLQRSLQMYFRLSRKDTSVRSCFASRLSITILRQSAGRATKSSCATGCFLSYLLSSASSSHLRERRSMRAARVDRPLAILIAVLVFGGIFIFSSAVFGLLARGATNMYSVVFSHLALGIGGGTAALLIASRIPYRLWRRFAPHLFVFALLLTAAVFIPQLGFEHGGGRRWLLIANFSIQPAEFLKAATIIFAAADFTAVRAKLQTLQWGFGGLLFILAGPGGILLAQPDLGTLGVIVLSALAIYI